MRDRWLGQNSLINANQLSSRTPAKAALHKRLLEFLWMCSSNIIALLQIMRLQRFLPVMCFLARRRLRSTKSAGNSPFCILSSRADATIILCCRSISSSQVLLTGHGVALYLRIGSTTLFISVSLWATEYVLAFLPQFAQYALHIDFCTARQAEFV